MNILEEITIEISPKDLKNILAEHFEKQGYKIENYHTELVQECTGYGMNESYSTIFNGIKIKAKKIQEEK